MSCQRSGVRASPREAPNEAIHDSGGGARSVAVLSVGDNGYPMGTTGSSRWGAGEPVPYGLGCAGSGGVPLLAAQGGLVPRIGTNFTARVTGLPFTGQAFLAVGASDTSCAGLVAVRPGVPGSRRLQAAEGSIWNSATG